MTTLFPMTAPGMPIPGADFINAAQALGDDVTEVTVNKKGKAIRLVTAGQKLQELTYEALYGRGQLNLQLQTKSGKSEAFSIVSGHRWAARRGEDWRSQGPVPCDVMIVGKVLSDDDLTNRRFLSDISGDELIKLLRNLGVEGFARWYVTGVLKTTHLLHGAGSIKPRWIADQAFLLEQEIRLVKPKFILMMGSEAVKVFCGKNATLSGIAGQVVDLEFDMRTSEEDTTPPLQVKAMGCMHPSAIVHKPEAGPQLQEALRRFVDLVNGGTGSTEEEDVDHRLIEDEDQLLDLCAEIDATTTTKIIAMDAEWHGDHPENEGAYLRTVQLSWAEKKAAAIKLRHAGGAPAFLRRDEDGGYTTEGGQDRVMEILTQFMQDKRPCGHYFVADLEWLVPAGLDLRKQFAAPERWEDMPTQGGLDTALMAHALEETGDFSLTGQVLTYTTAPRYDAILNKWKEDYCRENGIEKSQLEGYGDCPDEILIPYGNYDADVTYRLCMRHMQALDRDEYGNNCWKPYWISQRATLAVLEITRTGLRLDKQQVTTLTERYMTAKSELERKIREWACWPNLNLNSPFAVRELLFGRRYNGKDKVNGKRPRLRPKGAKSIATVPLVATGKPIKQWEEIVKDGKEDEATPSTDKLTLGILWHGSKQLKVWRKGEWVVRNLYKPIGWLRDYRFISQILKSVLRPPACEEQEGKDGLVYQHDDDGNLVYDAGLPGSVCSDGYVRTTIYQTKETGRWSSARPPLQNLSARREPDYKRILGDQYVAPLRSVLTAPPGWCLVEADYIGAELFVMAILSGDQTMLDHALRNQLPEDHPDYYDIHSNIAVLAFGFDCPPTKAGLKSIGKAHMRIVAKCVTGNTRIATDSGLVLMEELGWFIDPEDAYECAEGQVATTTGFSDLRAVYNGGEKECVRVTTRSGFELEASREHLFRVMGLDGDFAFKRADQLTADDYVCIRTEGGAFGNYTKFPKVSVMPRTRYIPFEFPEDVTEDWAAFFGLYLAEGCMGGDSWQISLAYEKDPELSDRANELFLRLFGSRLSRVHIAYEVFQDQWKYSVSSVDVAAVLDSHFSGLACDKRIPDFVFKWPERLQASLLRWLFAGDGTVKLSQWGSDIAYSTCSEQLAKDVQLLLLNFGIVTARYAETRRGYYNTYYVLRVSGVDGVDRFNERIGHVTSARSARAAKRPTIRTDVKIIPHQLEHLKRILPYVPSPVKEKCRECLRVNKRVNLNRSRLRLMLDYLELPADVPQSVLRSVRHLKSLVALDVVFETVRAVEDIGLRQVYDVETTAEAEHVVTYNGILTHQSVVFGKTYGRGPKAIALGAQEEGVHVTVEEAEKTIVAIDAMYPGLSDLLDQCRWRAVGPDRYSQERCLASYPDMDPENPPRWLCSPFGRFRRFPTVRLQKQRGEFERQAMNFPIQGTVADAISLAIAELYDYRENAWAAGATPDDLDYRIALQVHDALMVAAPAKHVPRVLEEILLTCMCERVPIYPTTMDGTPLGTGPYRFGVDTKVVRSWGVSMTPDDCLEIDLDPKYAGWTKYEDGYIKGGETDKLWLPGRGYQKIAAKSC